MLTMFKVVNCVKHMSIDLQYQRLVCLIGLHVGQLLFDVCLSSI